MRLGLLAVALVVLVVILTGLIFARGLIAGLEMPEQGPTGYDPGSGNGSLIDPNLPAKPVEGKKYYLTSENAESIVTDEYHITAVKNHGGYTSGEWTSSETYGSLIKFNIPELSGTEKATLHLKVIEYRRKGMEASERCDFTKKFYIKKLASPWDIDTANYHTIESLQQSGETVASFEIGPNTENISVEIPVSGLMENGFTFDQDDTSLCRVSFYGHPTIESYAPFITID